MNARQLAAFKLKLDRREKQAEQRAGTLAVARLRALLAKQGKRPTAAEERQAIADDKRKRQAEEARQRLRDADEANKVPLKRRIAL